MTSYRERGTSPDGDPSPGPSGGTPGTSGTSPRRTADEGLVLEAGERITGRPLTPQEEELHLAEARWIGDLD